MKRIGKRMRQVVDYVAAHPGEYMRAAALAVGPSQRFGYATVHRAVKAGLVRVTCESGARKRLWPLAA